MKPRCLVNRAKIFILSNNARAAAWSFLANASNITGLLSTETELAKQSLADIEN